MDEQPNTGMVVAEDGQIVMSKGERAWFLKRQGKTNSEIAQILGYSHPNSVNTAIKNALAHEAQQFTSAERQTLIALKYSELEDLRAAVWQSAMYGDTKAVLAALKVIELETKLTNLTAVDPAISSQTVLIVGGQERDYVNKLKEMVDE